MAIKLNCIFGDSALQKMAWAECKSYPFPAHVYFFVEYFPRRAGAAYVVDNQEPKHERNLDAGYPYKSPFAFALRLEKQFEATYDLRVSFLDESFLEASETLRKQLMLNQVFEQ